MDGWIRLLHRFLCARKYETSKAGEMLRKHLVWRFSTYRPFEIRCEEMQPHAMTGAIQVWHNFVSHIVDCTSLPLMTRHGGTDVSPVDETSSCTPGFTARPR